MVRRCKVLEPEVDDLGCLCQHRSAGEQPVDRLVRAVGRRAGRDRRTRAPAERFEAVHEALPAKHGFADVKSFIKALRSAARGKGPKAKKPVRSGRRKRAVITAATRAMVKDLVAAITSLLSAPTVTTI